MIRRKKRRLLKYVTLQLKVHVSLKDYTDKKSGEMYQDGILKDDSS